MDTANMFLVLLLATSCCALPTQPVDGSQILEEVVATLENGTDIQKTIVGKVIDSVAKIDETMREMEMRLSEISADIGVVTSDSIALTHEAFTTYRNAKSTLRIARNGLKKLADKTIRTTDDLILYMEAWDEGTSASDKKEYLAEQAMILRILLEESDQILGDAEKKYNQASSEIDAVNSKLGTFKIQIKQMLNENSAEHDSWVEGIRAGVYVNAAAVTVGMIIADIFGCFGACSAAVTSSTWVASVAAVETKIHNVETKLEELVRAAEKSVEGVSEIIDKTNNIQQFIQEETLIIAKWSNAADQLRHKIEGVKEDAFYRLSLKRKSFTESLKGLRDAAQEFWDRPDGIFGEEVLEKKMDDPVERSKNLKTLKEVQKIKNAAGFKLNI